MSYGLVVKHKTRGYLADYDPWGKQEFVWTVDVRGAWFFSSRKQAYSATRWLPRETLSIERVYKNGRQPDADRC
jgi:hypothetical protein